MSGANTTVIGAITVVLSADADVTGANTDVLRADTAVRGPDTYVLRANTVMTAPDTDVLGADTVVSAPDTDETLRFIIEMSASKQASNHGSKTIFAVFLFFNKNYTMFSTIVRLSFHIFVAKIR